MFPSLFLLAKTHSQLTMPMLLSTSHSVDSRRKVSTLGPSYWLSMVLGPTMDPVENRSPVGDTHQYNGNGELWEQLEELFNSGRNLTKVSQTKEPLGWGLKDGSSLPTVRECSRAMSMLIGQEPR